MSDFIDYLVDKLTSRKLWMSIAAFVAMLMVYRGAPEESAAQIAALIMAGAAVISYVLAEGWTDAAAMEAEENEELIEDMEDYIDTLEEEIGEEFDDEDEIEEEEPSFADELLSGVAKAFIEGFKESLEEGLRDDKGDED